MLYENMLRLLYLGKFSVRILPLHFQVFHRYRHTYIFVFGQLSMLLSMRL